MRILVTGAAGFIGFFLSTYRLSRGDEVLGVDSLNDYYDVNLKTDRLAQLLEKPAFTFVQADITDLATMQDLFARYKPERVVHLAAQAGVRYSLTHPLAYVHSNVVGFAHILDLCRMNQVEHLVYASTSSVYGANSKQPYAESDGTNHPLTMYAATKKSNELMAHSYSQLYGLPTTGLRFFTVYGPWGRPDMAFFSFAKAILDDEPIAIYNHGHMQRDFTYIDDIVEGISLALNQPAKPHPLWSADAPDPSCSYAPYRIYNIGRGQPVNLMDYIHALEDALGKTAIKTFLPMQEGDVRCTNASIERLENDLGYRPSVDIKQGIASFIKWYTKYHKKK